MPIELMEELPSFAHCLRRLRGIGRLITFDRRGVGTSDPFSPRTVPSLDDWVDDAVAVLDEAGSDSATVIGSVETAAIHLGEVELRGWDISGLNVNAAARVAAAAGVGGILLSTPVMEVLRGTDVDIEYHGEVELRGFAQPWPLYRLR